MSETSLYNIIVSSAESAKKLQRSDGSMPPGHNGPYFDKETPLRNTAHWLITFLKAYEIAGKSRFKKAAEKALEYLLKPSLRPSDATFLCRKEGIDKCNGLIGQAWVIEALVLASNKLNNEKCKKLAKDVFSLHPFNKECGLWKRVHVNGKIGTMDPTFNHQLWFAAAGSLLNTSQKGKISSRIERFLDKVEENLSLHRSGLIKHRISLTKKQGLKNFISYFIEDLKEKEVGYHTFNLYGFSLLKKWGPEHSFWKSTKFNKILKYILDDKNIDLEKSKYAYSFNPTGFEIAFTVETFFDYFNNTPKETIKTEVKKQLDKHYHEGKNMMGKNTIDSKTLSARLYESTRLSDLKLWGE